ncbi:hypothetical protein LZ31DRAFT_618684 [Colletotrichum somersetense]|nr:hypothetical protein LZ31DRAFT_618684 [Colletotrichum somersetense]
MKSMSDNYILPPISPMRHALPGRPSINAWIPTRPQISHSSQSRPRHRGTALRSQPQTPPWSQLPIHPGSGGISDSFHSHLSLNNAAADESSSTEPASHPNPLDLDAECHDAHSAARQQPPVQSQVP